jgi:hypothetical protein
LLFRVMCIAALVGACGTNDGGAAAEHTYDACAPLALVSGAPTDVQTRAMADAQALWRDRGAPVVGETSDTTLEVRFEKAALQFRGLYDDHAAVIYVNDGITDEATLSIVIAHELGHAFGLVHIPVSERPSVMNPGNVTTLPTLEDQTALQALWGTCP